MATHCSILTGIPTDGGRSLVDYSLGGSKRVEHNLETKQQYMYNGITAVHLELTQHCNQLHSR